MIKRCYIYTILLIVLCFSKSKAQYNFVRNPSFEIITHCPDGGGEIDTAIGWSTLKNGGGGNPELYNKCYTIIPSGVGVPSNFSGYQIPKTGASYAGIDAFLHDATYNYFWREYIQSKLHTKLVKEKNYCLTFYVSLSKFCGYSCNSIGAYLDSGSCAAPGDSVLHVTPQVMATQQLTDTLNWMKIEGSFMATGIEEYITIGNFSPDTTSLYPAYPAAPPYSYYYIDDVSVIDISLPAYAGRDTSIVLGDSVFIGRQSEVGLNDDCIWFVNGTATDTIAGKWVTPDSNTTYVLQQTICGTTTYDSVKVTVMPVGVKALVYNKQQLTVYPNPGSGVFELTLRQAQGDMNDKLKDAILTVTNVLGEIIYNSSLITSHSVIDLTGITKGLYFIQIVSDDKIYTAKFVKE